MRTFLRSMLIISAFAPALGCAAQADDGSESTAEALCKDPPCTPPNPNPKPPPPYVSPPDVSFQVLQCLSAEQEPLLISALKSAFPQAVDVLPSCNGTERVGIWLKAQSGSDNLAARQRGLPGINILGGGEIFAGHIAARYLTAAAYAGWANAPKVLSSGGSPDPNGPIHLNSFNITTNAPTQWITTIGGTDTDPWPDVDFTLTTTDTLSTANGRIQCNSQNSFNADTGLLNILTGVFLIAFPPLGGFFLYEDILVSGADTPSTTSGSIVCPAVSIFPAQILLPGTHQKATFSYTRAIADSSGITVGGWMNIVDRTPSLAIGGPTILQAKAGATGATGGFASYPTDLRSPLTYQWTASGIVTAPNASGTAVRFGLTGTEAVGTTKAESVSLHVVDADNTPVDAAKALTVKIVPPPDPDPDPPICRKKPDLPQCRTP